MTSVSVSAFHYPSYDSRDKDCHWLEMLGDMTHSPIQWSVVLQFPTNNRKTRKEIRKHDGNNICFYLFSSNFNHTRLCDLCSMVASTPSLLLNHFTTVGHLSNQMGDAFDELNVQNIK